MTKDTSNDTIIMNRRSDNNDDPPTVAITSEKPNAEYPGTGRTIFTVISLLLGVFLAGLDISIISTAIPAITSEFNSLSQSGWYGSVFFLTYASFQSVWGKAFKYFDLKYVFLVSIAVFEVGCLVCGVAPNSPALIVGRAIQGAGAGGILLGCYSISNFIVPPEKVPTIIGLIGTVFSVASVIGPLMGGVFTSRVTWRWCFYINLPIGAVPVFLILVFFKTPSHAKSPQPTSLRNVFLSFDPIGIVLLLASLICYFLALSWGGTERSWSSPTIIGLVIGWVLLTVLFFMNEVWQEEQALFVFRVMRRRHVWDTSLYLFLSYGAYFSVVYNIPTYFQATAGLSPEDSGIRTIPIILASSITTMISSSVVSKIGFYQPFLIIGGAILVISGGLICTFDVQSSIGKDIGYQTLLGIGFGLVVQIPPIVVGAVSADEDKAIALGGVLETQFYSAALNIAASTAITNNMLLKNIPKYAPSIAPSKVLSFGSYDLQGHFSGDVLQGVKKAYVDSLRASWIMGTAFWGLAFLAAFLVKWPGRMPNGFEAKAAGRCEERHPNTTET